MKHVRLRSYVVVFLALILLNFALPRMMPGGPIDFIEGQDSGPTLTKEQKESILAYYALDESPVTQWVRYMKGVVTLDFGTSFQYRQDVGAVIREHLPYTLSLVGVATLISIIISIVFGLYSGYQAVHKGDRVLFGTMLVFSALPEFLVGMFLLITYSVMLPIFPMSGAATPFLENASLLNMMLDRIQHAVLPITTLILATVPSLYLLMRNETVRIMQAPFIEFAQMKGIHTRTLLRKHVFKNALLPVFTMMMLRIGLTFTGAIFVETLFSYPGIGKLLRDAIVSRDYPLMHGLFFLFTSIILMINLLTDWVYPKLDPRIRKEDPM